MLLSIFLVCIPGGISQVSGQTVLDSILRLPQHLQLCAIDTWAHRQRHRDSTIVLDTFRILDDEARRLGRSDIRQQILLSRAYYQAHFQYPGQPRAWTLLREAIEEAADRDWYQAEAQGYIQQGYYYKDAGRWGPAFENMLKGYQMLKERGLDSRPEALRYIYLIGLSYYHFGEGAEALPFLLSVIHHPAGKEAGHVEFNNLNTVALAFQRAHQYDSAVHYFRLAYEDARLKGNTYWMTLIHGNLGYLLYQQGRYDDALPLMLRDFHESRRYGEIGSTFNSGLILATLYLDRNQLAEADTYLTVIRTYIPRDNPAALSKYYKSRFEYYSKSGDWKQAAQYADSTFTALDSAQLDQDDAVLNQARLKVEVERHAREIRELESARKRQVLLRNGILIILLLITIIMYQFFHRQVYKRRKELQVAELNEKMAREALLAARNKLDGYTRSLREKNDLIDAIREEMETLRQSGVQQMDERTERLNQLLQSTILTDQDWEDFRTMFEKVYPGFFIRLRASMPDLTPADTRLLALTKLNLSTKEMASILGISADSIKKSRQRLRRRLDLPEEGSLEELIEGL